MQLQRRCLKIDRWNANAFVYGFVHQGQRLPRQAIWLTVREGHFPALLTLERRTRPPRKYRLGRVAEGFDAGNFRLPLKYIAVLDCEYFIRNRVPLWETICSNGLFDCWQPDAPFQRFKQAKAYPKCFRLQLLRVYEIDHEFSEGDIDHATPRIDHLKARACKYDVAMTGPVIPDREFARLKRLLERSVEAYLIEQRSGTGPVLGQGEFLLPDEMVQSERYVEGATRTVIVNRYERNADARSRCLEHYGRRCVVCGLCFVEVYGEIGEDFIHVHHLRDLATIGKGYKVDPIEDLRPVCPNCHAMLHTMTPAMSLEKLRAIMIRTKRGRVKE